MKKFMQGYATPLISGLFLVSLISGIALFFHWNSGIFREMHEWLSMVLIIPFALHLWKNWRPTMAYFKHAPLFIALGLSLVAALAFAWPALIEASEDEGGRPPEFFLADKILEGTPAKIAPALDLTPDAVVGKLGAAGFSAATAEKPLRDIAIQSKKSDTALLRALLAD